MNITSYSNISMQKSSPCFTSLWFALILKGMRSLQKPEKPLARDSMKLI